MSVRIARVTGLLYLGLAAGGALGFLTIRPALFVAGDPAATLSRLTADPGLARLGVSLELFTVLTQALAAAGFYRLFHRADRFTAAGVAAFGLVNAVVVLVSAALLGAALQVGPDAAAVQTLYLISGQLWEVGGLFFGLWLIPMGLWVLRSALMPRALGWVLVAGGVGYVVSAFVGALLPSAGVVADLLVVPATVGEFWMIGYLLILGVRPAPSPAPAS
ncbi:DUF4386 domain-containing protein [Actinoplanes sp. NPDC051470]|uniref:DUF4386 domain-containing protein n=1 Tax=Actinoplanes sp. NPDC051470 TaxID=3157224 RepID=UPI00341CA496